MKKVFSIVLSMVCLLSALQLSVAAAPMEPEEKIEVFVTYIKRDSIPNLTLNGTQKPGVSLYTTILSDEIIPFSWTLDAKKANTTGTCKTNTTKILIPFDCDRTCSVKFELLDASGTSLAEKTIKYDSAYESMPVANFTGLTSSKTYKIRITNVNLFKMTITGAVREKIYF